MEKAFVKWVPDLFVIINNISQSYFVEIKGYRPFSHCKAKKQG